jgi:hypothetical protein
MDTCAFSEGLARLYAEFAHSIRENDSDSVRNAYKELRNSGRPVSEILDEAIRTIGISYEELENYLLGPSDFQPAPASQVGEPSVWFEPQSPEPGVNSDTGADSFASLGNRQPDTTGFALFSAEYPPEQLNSGSTKLGQVFGLLPGAIFSGFYARLAAWALVFGTTGAIVIAGLMTLPSTSKPAAVNKIVAGPVAVAAVSATSEHVAPAPSSPAPSTSVGTPPPATKSEKSNQQIGGAVTAPGSATKPDANASSASAETVIPVKAEAVNERANVADPSPKPIGTSAAGPEPLGRGGDLTPSSAHVQNEVNAVQAAQPVTAEVGANAASKETAVASKVPGPHPGSELSADLAWLLARGDALFRIGDVTSARGFYERAAENGNGRAALRLGESYDPSFLQQAHLASVRADTSAAIFWYRRARDLGVTEAQLLLRDVKGE